MRKSFLALAALAASLSLSTSAMAGDVKQEPTASDPVQMTDTEMDKVTAGFGFVEVPEAAFEHGFLVNQIGDPNQKARERAEQPLLRTR
jgi:hypothetical protein